MSKTNWIEHQGKKIFKIDFTNTDYTGIKEVIEEAKPVISKQPQKSVLCLVDTTGTKFALNISNAIKDFTLHNKPFMKMTAVIGLAGVQKVILSAAMVFTKRDNLVIKNSLYEALDWLVSQN